MRAAVKALQAFNAEHPGLMIDVAPEIEEDWGNDYAIVTFNLEDFSGSEFFDRTSAQVAARKVVIETLGNEFKVRYGIRALSEKRVKGELYLVFHEASGEIEAYRVK